MKNICILLTAVLGAALTIGSVAQAADDQTVQYTAAPRVHVLKREELDSLLAQPDKVLIIDVRRPDEITAIGGLPVYLSIQIQDLEKNLAWIPKDRLLVAISNHAGRASKAAEVLARHGFNVAGAAGAQTYEKEGGVLSKIKPPVDKGEAEAAGRNGTQH